MLWKKAEKNEFDERNARAWVTILSFVYSWEGTDATAHNTITHETLTQVFSKEFWKFLRTPCL